MKPFGSRRLILALVLTAVLLTAGLLGYFVLSEVGLQSLAADVVQRNDSGLIFEIGAFGDIVIEFGPHGLVQLVLHFVHVYL